MMPTSTIAQPGKMAEVIGHEALEVGLIEPIIVGPADLNFDSRANPVIG